MISAHFIMILEKIPTRKEQTACARYANAVPWRLAHRDNFPAKEPGLITDGLTPPTLSAYTRWPLAHIFESVRLSPSLHVNKVLS